VLGKACRFVRSKLHLKAEDVTAIITVTFDKLLVLQVMGDIASLPESNLTYAKVLEPCADIAFCHNRSIKFQHTIPLLLHYFPVITSYGCKHIFHEYLPLIFVHFLDKKELCPKAPLKDLRRAPGSKPIAAMKIFQT
jgi:hypothetical protein